MSPAPNLLDALKAHLQTGEVPESLRETLAGGVRTVPMEAESYAGQSASHTSHAQPPARRSRNAGAQRQVTGKLSLEELFGATEAGPAAEPEEPSPSTPGSPDLPDPPSAPAAPATPAALVAPRVTPAGEIEPGLPDPGFQSNYRTQRRLGAYYGAITERERKPQPLALTTDETLERDLQRSLEAPAPPRPWIDDAVDHAGAMAEAMEEDPGAEATLGVVSALSDPAPSPCEIPTDLDSLPLFGYVCGPAGVGKTYWAKEVARLGGDAVVLAATTGIASVNLGEGTTINTLLRYFDTNSLREAYTGGYLEAMLKRHRALGLQRILLDEVSMLSGDQLTILTRAMDNVNQDKPEGVGDLGLILLGDFAQLAPVPDRDPRDPKGFKKLPVAFAFESAEWERYGDHTLALTQIRRQSDRAFVEALQAVRRGAVGQALEYFAPRMVQTTDMQFQGPTIVAKNDAVNKYNQLRLDAVKGERVGFPSTRWGKVRPEWGAAPKPESEWGVPPVLQLKLGCRVMILANKNLAAKGEPPCWAYTNGDLGTLVSAEAGIARVKLDRTGTEVAVGMLQRHNEIPLEPGRRKALKAEGHPERISEDGKKEYIGGITYLPLRLAYCTTVHKSQGLSLDAVQINIRDSFFAQPGMLYVALSRARTAEGLRLVGSPEGFRARCTVNPKLRGYL